MRTTACSFPLPYDRSRVLGLVPRPLGRTRRRPPSNPLVEALYGVDLDRLPDVVSSASLLPAQARDAVLDVVLDVVGWIFTLVDQGVHRVFLSGQDLMMEVIDPCLACCASARDVRLPASFPLFCSVECLLGWADDNARDLPRVEGLDDLLRKTEDEAHARGVKEAEAETDAKVEEAVEEAMDTDDNPLLYTLRRYGSNPHVSVERAAWDLERGLRGGKIVL